MKITKPQLKRMIIEELRNTMSEADQWKMGRSMKAADLAAEIPPEGRAQYYRDKEPTEKEAAFTQHVADFEHIVTAITDSYGNERVKDVATELVRMVMSPPTGPNLSDL